jgi:hypothetical protein
MPEDNDVFSDNFQVSIGPFGCTLNFQRTGATLVAPGVVPQVERIATVRMSVELLKAVAFLVHRQVMLYETQSHVSVGLPTQILQGMQIRQEDWEAFWHP